MRDNYHFDKLIVVFGVLFTGVTLVSVGGALNDKHPDATSIAIGLLTSLFWLGIIALTIWGRFRTLQDKLEAERRSNRADREVPVPPVDIPKPLRDLMDGIKEAIDEKQKHDEHLSELAVAIAKDVLKGEKREATPEEVAKIESEFHDQSDGHYLKIHSTTDDGIDLEISEDPIDPVPGRSDAHEAARLRGDASRANAAKPLTKSQQRRINAQKGHGAITDDELREKRNAARRAKRAAKKAAEGGNTKDNGQLPGQTELVPPTE